MDHGLASKLSTKELWYDKPITVDNISSYIVIIFMRIQDKIQSSNGWLPYYCKWVMFENCSAISVLGMNNFRRVCSLSLFFLLRFSCKQMTNEATIPENYTIIKGFIFKPLVIVALPQKLYWWTDNNRENTPYSCLKQITNPAVYIVYQTSSTPCLLICLNWTVLVHQ